MTDPDVAEVAGGLTKAQREDVLEALEHDPYCPHFSRLNARDETSSLVEGYAAHQDPDCPPDEDGGTRWSFTPLGEAVRAHLLSSDKEG